VVCLWPPCGHNLRNLLLAFHRSPAFGIVGTIKKQTQRMKTQKTKIKSLTHFLFEVGTLRKLARSHRQTLLTDDLSDSIAAHSYRVIIIGYFLALEEKLDTGKVVKMCMTHDIGESRGGDQNWIHKKYVKVFEDEITKNAEITQIAKEYAERKTPEAKTAKDADLLDQLLLLREYEWQGNREAASWLKNANHDKMLFTKTARKIAKELRRQNPSEWWDNLWTSKRRM